MQYFIFTTSSFLYKPNNTSIFLLCFHVTFELNLFVCLFPPDSGPHASVEVMVSFTRRNLSFQLARLIKSHSFTNCGFNIIPCVFKILPVFIFCSRLDWILPSRFCHSLIAFFCCKTLFSLPNIITTTFTYSLSNFDVIVS